MACMGTLSVEDSLGIYLSQEQQPYKALEYLFKPVGRQSANSRATVEQLSANSRATIGRMSADCWSW